MGRAGARPLFLARNFAVEDFDMNKPSMQIGLGIALGAGIGAAMSRNKSKTKILSTND